MMSRVSIVSAIKVSGVIALQNKDVINSIYSHILKKKDESVKKTLDLTETLLKYGSNFLAVDYFFTFLCSVY